MHDVASPRKVLLPPTQPSDHLGFVVADTPEIRLRVPGKPAGYGIGLPQGFSRAYKYRQRKIWIQRAISLRLPRRERRGKFKLDLRIEIACHRDREAGIGIAAEQ